MASFTGAASYSFPIQVPQGPGGLQPALALSYNSQVVDSATTKTQASWVGMGWSLDTGYIARNMNGTNEYNGGNYGSGTNIRMDDDWKSSGSGDTFTGTDGDDTFSLVLNGQSWGLLRIPDTDSNENTIEYRTAEESFYRIVRYHSHSTDPGYVYDYSYWKVWDKTGMTYTFQDRAWYPSWRTDMCAAPFMMTWQWSLSRVQNVFGKEISYQYTKYPLAKNHPWDDDCSGYGAYTDMAIVPTAILYPENHYRIQFVRKDRTDYDTAWLDSLFYTQFDPWLLERIEVWQDPDGTWQNGDDKLVRKYLLGYNNGVIFPNLTWSAGGKTPGLASITEYGLNGAGPLPATTFTYDSMHLIEASNGYGGKVVYGYETAAWHEIESSADPLTPAGMEENWIYDWTAEYRCNDTAGYDKTVYPPAAVLHPGQVYKFSIKLYSPCLGDYNLLNPTSFGLLLSSNGSSKAVAAEEKKVTYIDSTTGTVTAYLRVPASISFGQFYINVTANAVLYEYRVWPVATRYRVQTKTVTDQVTNLSSTVTYKYDEPATNDAAHSEYIANNTDYYDKPYTQFLGHAMTQAIQPGGQVNTTFYNQGDHRRGMPSAQLVHTQDFFDDFASLGSDWAFNAATQGIPYLNGDPALNITSDTSDYNTWARRSAYSLTNGEMVLVQFRLQGSDLGMRLRWEQASGSRYFGLEVLPTSHTLMLQYYGAANVPMSGSLVENTWYSLLLTLDNEEMMVRLWKRDDPSTAKRPRSQPPGMWKT